MGVIARRLIKENYHEVEVFINDTTNTYFNIEEFPTTFTQGRSAFKIFGSEFLRTDIPLKMEILDSAGNTVYITPVDVIGESNPTLVYRYITVEVYRPPINQPGLGTLTILGELDPAKFPTPIPSQFQDTYNVKLTKKVNIDVATAINTQPIRFYRDPTVITQEVVRARLVNTPLEDRSVSGSLAHGSARDDMLGFRRLAGSRQTNTQEGTGQQGTGVGSNVQSVIDSWKYRTGAYGTRALSSRRGRTGQFGSPIAFSYKIYVPFGDDNYFNSQMVGGTIEIPRPKHKIDGNFRIIDEDVSATKVTNFYETGSGPEGFPQTGSFTASIISVPNRYTVVTNIPYETTVYESTTGGRHSATPADKSSRTPYKYITKFNHSAWTASYAENVIPVSSSVHFDSFLDMTIRNMRTFSGDVYKLKIHGASENQMADYSVLADQIVESPELLVDSASPSGYFRFGYFIDQDHINTYWQSSSYAPSTGGNVVLTSDSSEIIDALHLSGSTYGKNEYIIFQNKSINNFLIRKDIPYTLTAHIKGKKTKKVNSDGNVVNEAELFFHLSGSRLVGSKLVNNSVLGREFTNENGKAVSLRISSDENISGYKDFDIVEHTFLPNFKLDKIVNRDTSLQIRANSGEWQIGDLSLRPASETGFSPDEFKIRVPLPRSTRPDNFDFVIEYFDINSNTAETVTMLEAIGISGSNLVLDGDDNLLTGSLFFGNAIGEGIESAGATSAYMRAVGYHGFTSASEYGYGGFIIFSGSVLPNSGDQYAGAGLEIHDGTTGSAERYFRFRTNMGGLPNSSSLFKVKTDTFFLGTSTSTFISGSDGNIEISSSKFHVQPDGDVVMNDITASSALITGSSNIGGWLIGRDPDTGNQVLSGSNAVLDATGAALYRQAYGPQTAKMSGYYIDFTPSGQSSGNKYYVRFGTNFAIRDDGILIASGAVIEGQLTASTGKIADWTISDTTLHKYTTSNTYTGLSSTGPVRFFAGAASLAASGSAPFNVKQSGVITASAGRIGGWTLNPDPELMVSPSARITMSAVVGAERITVRKSVGGDSHEILRMGEISDAAGSLYGLKIYDGTGTYDDDKKTGQIVLLGEQGNKIGGWELDDTKFRSIPKSGLKGEYDFDGGEDGLILQSNVSESRIETAGFVSGLKGFRMSSLGNGSAEFENMRIRGTLRTTVFEKETVNVVGGQLMVANSTTLQSLKSASVVLAGSSSVSATDVTMSVANASGFSRGEILKVKAVDDAGFSVEYLYVTGSKRFSEDPSLAYLTASLGTASSGEDMPPLDPDGIAGELYVGRAYGSIGPSQISSSIGVISGSIGLVDTSGTPVFGASASIFINTTGSLAVQDIISIGEERMKITGITGSGTEASGTLFVIRDYHDTLPTVHADGAAVTKVNTDMEFLAGLVSTARPYQEGQVIVSTGKYATGTDWNGRFDYQENVSSVDAAGKYKLVSGSTLLTTDDKKDATSLQIHESGSDGTGHDALYSLFDKGSYIVLLVESPYGSTSEWYRYRVNGNPSVTGAVGSRIHTFPIKLNQDFHVVGDNKNTADEAVDFWFMSNIQDVSSGYILMNANPNDPYSPYMDIVERTGPDVYDLQLRTRLGDLSGLSSAYLYGDEEPGFGLYTENGFFKGTIHAMTGSIHGILHVATVQGGIETGERISIGRQVSGTNDGIMINDTNNYWWTTGDFRVGSAAKYLKFSNTYGTFELVTDDINIDTTTFDLSTDGGGMLALGGSSASLSTLNQNGIFFSGSGLFNFQESVNSYVRRDSSGISMRSANMIISSSTFEVNTAKGGTLELGATPSMGDAGIFMSGSGQFNLQQSATQYIRYDSALEIKTPSLELDTSNIQISSTNASMSFGPDTGSIIIDGTSGGHIRGGDASSLSTGQGFYMSGSGEFRFGSGSTENQILFQNNPTTGVGELSITTPNFTVTADGDVDAINATLVGRITANEGAIGGWNISENTLYANSVVLSSISKSLEMTDDSGRSMVVKMGGLTATGSVGGGTTLNDGAPSGVIGDNKVTQSISTTYTSGQYDPATGATGSAYVFSNSTTLANRNPAGGANSGYNAIEGTDGKNYIVKVGLSGSCSSSLFKDGNGTHGSSHLAHSIYGTATVDYKVELRNTSNAILGSQTVSKTYTSLNLTDTTTDNLHNTTILQSYKCKMNPMSLQFNVSIADDLNVFLVVSQSVTATSLQNVYIDQPGLEIGTIEYENTDTFFKTAVASAQIRGNSNLTEITTEGIQTIYDPAPGADGKFFMADFSKSGATDFFLASAGYWVHHNKFYAKDDITAYYSSDKRLKENIEIIDDPIKKLNTIKGVSFEWKDKKAHPADFHNERELGVIAQDVLPVLPEVVTQREDGFYAIKYDQLIPVLIEALKEQQKQIEDLQEYAHEPQNYKEKCVEMEERIILLEKQLEVI